MELQAGENPASRRDDSATVSASGSPRIADEVLVLVNAAPKIAEAIFDAQSTVDPIAVRTPIQLTTTPTHHFTR